MSSPVAVVVPTRDRPEMLDRCLASVRASLRAGDELVVVDSASRDGAAVAAVAHRHGARLIRAPRAGVDLARNLGWRSTTAALVLFADDDVVVDAGWAAAFADAGEQHREVAFFPGRIGIPDGQPERWQVAVLDEARPRRIDRGTRGILGHGASLGVRREWLERIGGWDELMGSGARFASAPELDLFDRLLAAGAVGRYEPQARAWHDQWRTPAAMIRLHVRYGIGVGARIAKLLRLDRRRAATVARDALWEWGVRSLALRLRHLDRAGALTDAGRLVGYLLGFVAAVMTPVRDGHFRARRSGPATTHG